MSEWVNINIEHPRDGQKLLISTKDGYIFHSTYNNSKFYTDGGINFNINGISAWMPSPEPYIEHMICAEAIIDYLNSERSEYEAGIYDSGRNAMINKTIEFINKMIKGE